MYGGHIVEAGKTKSVCSDPWHPYTKQLMEAVPEADPIRSAKIKAVREKVEQIPAVQDVLLREDADTRWNAVRKKNLKTTYLKAGKCPVSCIRKSTAAGGAEDTR